MVVRCLRTVNHTLCPLPLFIKSKTINQHPCQFFRSTFELCLLERCKKSKPDERRGLSNSLSVSGLETKRTNSRKIPSHFPVKLVIIASKFAIVIEVTILSCDGLVVITNEFAIIIKDTRLSCDGPVILGQSDRTFGARLNLV